MDEREEQDELEYPREEFPLHRLTKTWRKLIKRAEDHKREKFDEDAAEAMAFFRANSREMEKEGYLYGQDKFDTSIAPEHNDFIAPPSFKICVAKVSEIVQLFGPALYQRDPYRQVTPRQTAMEAPIELFMPPQALMPQDPMQPIDPMLQQQVLMAQQQYQQFTLETQQQQMRDGEVSRLLGKYLNYTPRELHLRRHARKVIDEALIKGMGVFWHELYRPYPDSPALVGSFYDTVDNLLIDPDAETLEDAKWIARKRIRPYWEVAAEFGFKQEVVRRKMTSKSSAQNEAIEEAHEDDDEWVDSDREKCDLVTYYEIYSKMGMGDLSSTDEEIRGTLEDFGQFCRIVIHKTYKHPLNMGKKLVGMAGKDERATQKLVENARWPVPFWADGAWPCTMLAFHEQPNCVWPISHVKPGLAELKFMNWAMGYLANKVRTSSRTLMACAKAHSDEFKRAIKEATDYSLLEINTDFQQDISKLVTFLQGPDFKIDLYKVIEAVADQFDKRVGLSEILYGMSNTQDRSATETMTKNENASSRINDMLDLTEEAMTECARKEAFMARWLLTGDDMAPYIGRVDAMMWDNFVASTEIEQVVREFEYTLEADSGRKPNRNTQIAMMDGALQTLMPFFQQLAMGGNVEPYNALMESWGKLNGFVNTQRMLIAPPPPPPQMMPPEQGGEVPPEQGASA